MGATITYKGNTLTTVTNQTRTLNTSGKYLEDNITIVDVSIDAIDGDSLGYGNSTVPIIGVGQIGYAALTASIVEISQADFSVLTE